MELGDLLDALNSGEMIPGGSPLHAVMHEASQDALRVTAELNGASDLHAGNSRASLKDASSTERPASVSGGLVPDGPRCLTGLGWATASS